MKQIKNQMQMDKKNNSNYLKDNKKWKVLYNRDSDIWNNLNEPVNLESLYNFMDPIIGKVDTYIIDPGGKVQNYPTKAGEMYGEDEALWFEVENKNENFPESVSRSQFHRRQKMNLQSIRNWGNPICLIIDHCHKKGIKAGVSRRMNDCHPSPTGYSHLYSKFFINNPRYWLYPKYANLNFEMKEVIENTLCIIKEYCDLFDIDILELDFLRHPMYFKSEVSQTKRFRIMNSIVEEIREYSLAVGKKRGRNILLQTRIPSTIDACENVGLDVKAWIKNAWVDALVPSPAFSIEFDIPIENWKKLTGQTPILIYPGTDFCIMPEGEPVMEPTIEMWRGAFARYSQDGADGIHLFNTFCGTEGRKIEPEVIEIAKNPEQGMEKNKYYLLTRTSQIEWTKDAAKKMQIPVEIIPGKHSCPLKIDFPIADNFKKHLPIELVFRLQINGLNETLEDEINVSINGGDKQ